MSHLTKTIVTLFFGMFVVFMISASFQKVMGLQMISLESRLTSISQQNDAFLSAPDIAETQTALAVINPPTSTICFGPDGNEIRITFPSLPGFSFDLECQRRGGTVSSTPQSIIPYIRFNGGDIPSGFGNSLILPIDQNNHISWNASPDISYVSFYLRKGSQLWTIATMVSSTQGVEGSYVYSYGHMSWLPMKVIGRSTTGKGFSIEVRAYDKSRKLKTTTHSTSFTIIPYTLSVEKNASSSNLSYTKGTKRALIGSFLVYGYAYGTFSASYPYGPQGWSGLRSLEKVVLKTGSVEGKLSNVSVELPYKSFRTVVSSSVSVVKNNTDYTFTLPLKGYGIANILDVPQRVDVYADISASSTVGTGSLVSFRSCTARNMSGPQESLVCYPFTPTTLSLPVLGQPVTIR